jgi:hypothetical protein
MQGSDVPQSSLAFHLAMAVNDLDEARRFYCDLLGCREGRSGAQWTDFDFFGHQLSVHLAAPVVGTSPSGTAGSVDGKHVDIPHFGVILARPDFDALVARLQHRGVAFVSPPTTRFPNCRGEQSSFFLRDPSGNTLEFKTFRHVDQLFDG